MGNATFRRLIPLVALGASVALACAPAPRPAEAPATTFLLVRHAEKDTGDDPALTAEGTERARALARAVADLGLDAVYATPFVRTRETARLAAEAAGVEVRTDALQAADVAAHYARLVPELIERHAGRRVLLVGHSNTVPAVIAALGVADVPELGDQDYDDLFVVSVGAAARVEFLHLHYGAPSP